MFREHVLACFDDTPYHYQQAAKGTHVEMALLGLTGEPTEGTGSGVSDRDGIG